MFGRVKEYDEVNEMGYIEGFDERIYFYHQTSVVMGEKLKVGEMVQFRYDLTPMIDALPVATNIFKVEKEKSTNDEKAYKEVYEIIQKFPKEEREKIPLKFIETLKQRMDKIYPYRVEHITDFENQEMMEETKALLAVIYRDFLASKEEKEEILAKEHENQFNDYQKTSYTFPQKELKMPTIEEAKIEVTALTEKQKETWLEKFKNWVKQTFKK